MSDDGLLLNFSTEPVSIPAKKVAQTKKQRLERSFKRDIRPLESNFRIRSSESKFRINKPVRDKKSSEKKEGKPARETKASARRAKNDKLDKNTFVSSLFSENDALQSSKSSLSSSLTLDPSNAPDAGATFESLGVDRRLASYLSEKLRLKTPTLIQKKVVPALLSAQQDLFIQAQTGSGKTLSFALPIFHTLMNLSTPISRESGVFAVVLAPSRELATQIYAVFEDLSKTYVRIVPGIVIGGEKKKSEKARLRKGVNILVSTPGRLLDHLKTTKNLNTNLSLVKWLVLDEGDRLMELGFEETIKGIVEILEKNTSSSGSRRYPELPSRRINILASATIKKNVEKLGQITLKHPKLISAGSEEKTAPSQLTQQVLVVPPKLRLATLSGILTKISKSGSSSKTIVFLSCSDSVEFHFDVFTRSGKTVLSSKGGNRFVKSAERSADIDSVVTGPLINKDVQVYKLHGMLPQHTRTTTLNHFASSENCHSVLFCTDVASRGLDLPVTRVIEYDPSFSIDEHLHRVGRTARAGKIGKSMLFLLPGDEERYVEKIRPFHPSGFETVNYEDIIKSCVEEGKKWDVEVTTWHLTVERWLLEDSGQLARAEKAFMSHIRAYATHLSSERDCFNIKSIHLGHLAKSFGLRESPKNLGKKYGKGDGKEGKKREVEDPKKKLLKMASIAVNQQANEFNFM